MNPSQIPDTPFVLRGWELSFHPLKLPVTYTFSAVAAPPPPKRVHFPKDADPLGHPGEFLEPVPRLPEPVLPLLPGPGYVLRIRLQVQVLEVGNEDAGFACRQAGKARREDRLPPPAGLSEP